MWLRKKIRLIFIPCKKQEVCVCPCLVCAAADHQHQGIKFISVQDLHKCVCMCVCVPAVRHNWPSIWRVEELDLSYEAQQPGSIAGDAMVRPAGEVELTELTDLVVTLLKTHTHRTWRI